MNNTVMNEVRSIPNTSSWARLLKLAGLVDSGSYAKIFISEGLVKVNGEVDLRRGRKVYPGDVVSFEDNDIKVV